MNVLKLNFTKLFISKTAPFIPPTVVEPTSASARVVASTATATNVVKGFNLPQKDVEVIPQKGFDLSHKFNGTPRSQSPASARGQSPASGRGTPIQIASEGDEPRGESIKTFQVASSLIPLFLYCEIECAYINIAQLLYIMFWVIYYCWRVHKHGYWRNCSSAY